MTKPSIDRLFRTTATGIKIAHNGKEMTVNIRTLGAAEDQQRADYAIGRARHMLYAVPSPDSPEHAIYARSIQYEPRAALEERAQVMQWPNLFRAARDEIKPPDPIEPGDNPSLAEIVEAQVQTEEVDAQRDTDISELLKEKIAEYAAEVAAMDDILLHRTVIDLLAQSLANRAFTEAHEDFTLYAAVYTDAKFTKRLFESPDEPKGLQASVREQLLAEYDKVDAFTGAQDELKN